MCLNCRLNECTSWREECLCECHNIEYTPGYDDQEDDDGNDAE